MDKLFGGLIAGLIGGAAIGIFFFGGTLSDAPTAGRDGDVGAVAGTTEKPKHAGATDAARIQALNDENERLKTENVRLLSQVERARGDLTILQQENAVRNANLVKHNRDLEQAAAAQNIVLPPAETEEVRIARLERATKIQTEITMAVAANDKATALARLEELKKAGPGSEAQYLEALKAIMAVGIPQRWGGQRDGADDKNKLGLSWDEYNRLLTREIRDYVLLNASTAGASPEVLRLAGQQAAWDQYLPRDEQNKMLNSLLDGAPDKSTQITAIRSMRIGEFPENVTRISGLAVNGGLDAEVREAAIESLSRVADKDESVLSTLRSLESDSNPRVSSAARRTVLAAKPPVTGYLISQVFDQGQAKSAGLQVGDIIVRYNGQVVESENIRPMQNSIPEGQKGELQVHRTGSIVRLYVNRGPLGVDGQFVRGQ